MRWIGRRLGVGWRRGPSAAARPRCRRPRTAGDAHAPTAPGWSRITDPRIIESSGLTTSPTDPDIVWTVNDSGDSARAFAVSLETGRTVGLLKERTDARDCEAMTSGRDTGRPPDAVDRRHRRQPRGPHVGGAAAHPRAEPDPQSHGHAGRPAGATIPVGRPTPRP